MAVSQSENETQKIASELTEEIRDGGVVCLYGDLGSGKTSFTKGIAETLGIEKFSIKSPTYTYVREYHLEGRSFYHIDLYRLDGPDDLIAREIQEMIENPRNIIIIEWADKVTFALPEDKKEVYFKYLGKDLREVTIK